VSVPIFEIGASDRRKIADFLQLPFELYRQTPQWVPPFAYEARNQLNRSKNPYFEHSDALFLIAYDDSRNPLGRLAILDNRNYNQFHNSKTAFFFLFECIDDANTARELFNRGFEWSLSRGLDYMMGPKGFTAMDGQGLLVEGFQHRPAFGVPYNLPYYEKLIQAAGFQTQRDLLSGYIDRSIHFPDRVHRVAEKVARRRGLSITNYTRRSQLRAIVPKIKDLYNAALATMPGNTPLTDSEAQSIANQILWFADPRLIKIVLKDDEPVGFVFSYPDISAAVQRTKGRLFPFGWVQLLLELRRTKWVTLNGAGIIEEQQGLGSIALLFSQIARDLIASRFEYGDMVQIRSDNEKMLREVEKIGMTFYKRHRLYERFL
jgi:hypothetical protein